MEAPQSGICTSCFEHAHDDVFTDNMLQQSSWCSHQSQLKSNKLRSKSAILGAQAMQKRCGMQVKFGHHRAPPDDSCWYQSACQREKVHLETRMIALLLLLLFIVLFSLFILLFPSIVFSLLSRTDDSFNEQCSSAHQGL